MTGEKERPLTDQPQPQATHTSHLYPGNISSANQSIRATVQTFNLNHMMLIQGTQRRE
jgi:hypothetical protein